MIDQHIKLNVKTNNGATKKKIQFDFSGIILSLINNLKPSANGCNKPNIPTTFGPFRRCIAAITLRSAIVKNAIQINAHIIIPNRLIIR